MRKDDLLDLLQSRDGTPMLVGKPGIGKSAVLRWAFETLGYDEFVDLRLPMLDEVDVGGMIVKADHTLKDGRTIKVVDTAYPRWAVMSREKRVFIVLEELNRANKYVQNAALGIMNERRVGNLDLGPETIIVATGNCGESDGTDVEEFDSSVRGRIIRVNYDMSLKQWVDDYAAKNVVEEVVTFVECNPSHYYKYAEEGPYASPRSWTFLSSLIKSMKARGMSGQDIMAKMQRMAPYYVGASGTAFYQFLRDKFAVTLKDVLAGKIPGSIERSNILRLLKDLHAKHPGLDLTADQFRNLRLLLDQAEDDVLTDWLIKLTESPDFTPENSAAAWSFIRTDERFKSLLRKIKTAADKAVDKR